MRTKLEEGEMKVVWIVTVAAALVLAAAPASPQRPAQAEQDLDRIVGMAMTSGGARAFLRKLTDSVGGRVTGTAESEAAADLLLGALRDIGLDNAHVEEYALASRWRTDRAAGRVVAPVNRPLIVGAYGWTPGTKGGIEAPLVDLGAPPGNDLPAPAEQVRGAAVIVEPHAVDGAPSQVMRRALAHALAGAGAAVMLIPSDKPNRMLYTSAFGFYPVGPLPVLSVARDDTLFLRRLLAAGPVRVSLDVANAIDSRPAQERNVVAEIAGTSPGEVVLVGAHFDSWDAGQGAQDDGVGVAAVLETARILKSLGVKPRRTIRFVFFSGEEQGLLGSRAYVERHRAELDELVAVLIMDSGAQVPRGLQVHGREDLEARTRSILAPLASLGASGVSLDASFDMDHGPFMAAGIPAFTLWVDEGQYDTYHHTVSDTFDTVDPRMLALDTATMAAAAYRFADAAEAPGRRLSASEAAKLMKQLGLDTVYGMLYAPAGTGQQDEGALRRP